MEQLTRAILREELKDFKTVIDTSIDDKMRIHTDLLRQEMKAVEVRLEKKIESSEKRILLGVADMLDGNVVPQLDDHERRLTKLETKPA